MKNKLVEMFEMQRALDKRILESKGLRYDSTKVQLALIAECGELLNERPDIFKYWKSKFVVDHRDALEELVDVWHFALSINIEAADEIEESIEEVADVAAHWYQTRMAHYKELLSVGSMFKTFIAEVNISDLLCLTDMLGYTFDEVYNEYMRKNAINHQRVETGY